MKTKSNFYSKLFISFLLIFTLFPLIYLEEERSYLEHNYNSAIKMNNGNIFLINQIGMFVTEKSFSSVLFSHLFTSNEQITSISLMLQIVIIQYPKNEGGNILAHTYNKIYFFSPEGEYINNHTLSDDFNGVNVQLPQLILLPSTNNYYNYVIIFSDQFGNIVFYYYKIKKDGNENSLINIYNYPIGDTTSYEIFCGKMYLEEYGDIISCFYFSGTFDAIKVSHFNPNKNFTSIDLEQTLDNLSILSYSPLDGAISEKKDIALICYTNENSKGFCTNYDIKKNKFILNNIYASSCNPTNLLFSVNYFSETKEFVFVCSDNSVKLSLFQFNENGTSYITPTENGIVANYSIGNCPSVITFSLLCYENEKIYNFILSCLVDGIYLGTSENVPDSVLSHELEFIENNEIIVEIIQKEFILNESNYINGIEIDFLDDPLTIFNKTNRNPINYNENKIKIEFKSNNLNGELF